MADLDNEAATSSTPLWVKVVALVGVVLLALILVALLTGRGGGHGPGRHLKQDSDTPGHTASPPAVMHTQR